MDQPSEPPTIPIATLWRIDEAYLVRTILTGHGIDVFLENEHQAALSWPGTAFLLGGIRVHVRSSDAELARAILFDSESGKSAALSEAKQVSNQCPRCHAHETVIQTAPRRFAFVAWLLAGAPWPGSRRLECTAYGLRWPAAAAN